MSFSKIRFCGLSVMDFKTSLGLGPHQVSTLNVSMVQDIDQGDTVSPPAIGTPIYFNFHNLRFHGLLQRWSKSNSPNGFPVYSAVCTDPREILEGCSVILNAYNGQVFGISNVVNVYGWYENLYGFGAALANESGMPWHLVLSALTTICNTPGGSSFGGPLQYQGVNYGLDLSELPVPPTDYRVGGTHAGLLELIAAVCEDGGRDFFVQLVGYTIKIRTISRVQAPPLGTIEQLTQTNHGNVLRSEYGVESRNEITSAFLVGGDVHGLHNVDKDSIFSYWGEDINGNPIFGVEDDFVLKDSEGNEIQTITTESMELNARGVADIIGDVSYNCTTLELRLALVSANSWGVFIRNHRPDVKAFVFSPFENAGGDGVFVKPNAVDDSPDNAAMAAINSDFAAKSQRLYEFVRDYATEFYGKRWAVRVPFVTAKVNPENPLDVTFSMEPADGAWMEEGTSPLSLPAIHADAMKTGDGRFRPMARFDNMTGKDLSRVNKSASVQTADSLYVQASVERGFRFFPGSQIPCVIMTLNSAVHDEAVSPVGDESIIAAVLGKQPGQARPILDSKFGNLGVAIWPQAHKPNYVSVPLKSNTLCYGPWYKSGVPGKVKFEIDPSLTPWNYGSIANMNLAGLARVALAESKMQVSETGTLELAGPPLVSLGDALLLGGPNATNIDVSYGKDGVTTSYRFQTFTPRFGVFSKQLAERIKKIGLNNMELRKAIRSSLKQGTEQGMVLQDAMRGFMANAGKVLKRESPHEVILCHSVGEIDEEGEETGENRVCPMSMTFEEAVVMTPSGDDYKRMALSSMDGLFRPFSTGSSCEGMPHFITPTNTVGVTSDDLNPYKSGNDISYLAWGESHEHLHSYVHENDPEDTRAIALRGPLIVAGWGYDLKGQPVPGNGSGGFASGYLRKSQDWKVGAIDLLWDEKRGVWTPHGNLEGTTAATINAGSSGTVNTSEGLAVTAHNIWSSEVGSGVKVFTIWNAQKHRWVIIAADCED